MIFSVPHVVSLLVLSKILFSNIGQIVDSSFQKMIFGGRGGGPKWGIEFLHRYIKRKIFSKAVWPEKLNLKCKHPWVMQIQDCSNQSPWALDEATMGGGGQVLHGKYRENVSKSSSQKSCGKKSCDLFGSIFS